MSSKRPHFFVVSSPSGGGKTTLLKGLLKERTDLRLSVSYTTRSRRFGEIEGQDYYFVSDSEFREKVARGEFLEWEEVHGACYGTPKAELKGPEQDLIFDVDTKGALRLRELYPETTLIFIQPPSQDVLVERLRSRGTEDDELIKRRLESFRSEMAEKDKFDYAIINDKVERATEKLKEIIQSVQEASGAR